MLDLISNGDGLAVVAGGCNQKEIGEAGVDGVEFEDAGVLALFVFTGLGCGLDEYACLLVCLRCRHSVETVSSVNRRPSPLKRQNQHRQNRKMDPFEGYGLQPVHKSSKINLGFSP
jgi:hypothetical protein